MIYLLTHEREFDKKSGTGKLVKQVLGNKCEVIPWSRVEPDKRIESGLDPKDTALVYISEDSETNLNNYTNFIILDGTWQEAKKIYNKSLYLKRFNTIEISGVKSEYQLRKNQKDIGLCTAEIVREIFREKGDIETATKIDNLFKLFNKK